MGEKDGKPWRFRNLIKVQIAGKTVELHQDKDLPLNRHKLAGGFVSTTKLYVRNVEEAELSQVQGMVGRICELLSFATESRVMAYGHEFPAGSGLGGRKSVSGTVQWWRPPFDDPADAVRFLEICYLPYSRLRDARKLHVLIDYIHHSIMAGLAEEVKISLACIAFENLRDNWARDSGYPHLGGFFRAKGATEAKKGQTVGFRKHLEKMLSEVGMVDAPLLAKRIVDTRNEVLHTGLYGNLKNDEIHQFLETTLREYFLRLVGYRGNFSPYVGGSPKPNQI